MGIMELLRVPGPTPVPARVLEAMSKQVIYHRSIEFGEVIDSITTYSKAVFKTKNDIMVFSASGRGVMEAAIVNLLSPHEKALFLVNGFFGNVFSDIARNFRVDVETLEFPWGDGIDLELVEKKLQSNSSIRAMALIHCETSTGVLANLEEIGKIARKYGVLSIVDSVSALGGNEMKMDEWGLDVVLTASQKALMTPPGLGLVAVSNKAWKTIETSANSRYYWDFRKYKDTLSETPKRTPFTSPVNLMFGLNEALKMMNEEGIDNVILRHKKVANLFRNACKSFGIELFPKDEKNCSNTVTVIRCPNGIHASEIVSEMLEKDNLRIATGHGSFKEKILRIGHMGVQANEQETLKVANIFKKYFLH